MTLRIFRFLLHMIGGALAFITAPLWGPLVLILIAVFETGIDMYEWVRRIWKESAE